MQGGAPLPEAISGRAHPSPIAAAAGKRCKNADFAPLQPSTLESLPSPYSAGSGGKAETALQAPRRRVRYARVCRPGSTDISIAGHLFQSSNPPFELADLQRADDQLDQLRHRFRFAERQIAPPRFGSRNGRHRSGSVLSLLEWWQREFYQALAALRDEAIDAEAHAPASPPSATSIALRVRASASPSSSASAASVAAWRTPFDASSLITSEGEAIDARRKERPNTGVPSQCLTGRIQLSVMVKPANPLPEPSAGRRGGSGAA
jgi:hypothetical protein